jgi:hypothetical protein
MSGAVTRKNNLREEEGLPPGGPGQGIDHAETSLPFGTDTVRVRDYPERSFENTR